MQRSRLYILKRSPDFDTLEADKECFRKTNAGMSQIEPNNLCDTMTDTI